MVPLPRRNNLCPCTSSLTHLRHASHPQCRSAASFNTGHKTSSRPVTTATWFLAVGWVCLTFLISTLWVAVPTHALPTASNNHAPPQPLLIPLRRLTPNQAPSSTSFKKTKRSSSPSGATPISVTTVGRVGYAGHILIGTPPQRLSVLFDTGSDLALVISDHCQGLECPELTHFSCSNSASCVDLGGGGVGASARPTIVFETELATTDSSPSPPMKPEAAIGGGDVTPLQPEVSSTLQEHERERNGGAGVREETSRSTSHGGQEHWQQVHSKTQHHQQQRRDNIGHDNGDPSTLMDRLRSSKTLPPSQPQLPTADVNDEAMTTSDGHPPMVAARLIGPEAVKIEESLQPLHHDTPKPAFSVEKVHSAAASIVAPVPPPPTPPLSNFYNQTYVDGSWGAGTFVQDRIQVDTTPPGEVFNPYHHMNDDGSFESSSTGHVATVTFLDVVQDNLGLVKGYDGQISGLLGLTRASPTGRKTFLQELVDQGSLAQPVVSMHLGAEGGSFLLGGIDSSQYSGQLVYSPVTDPVTWQMSLQGLGIRYRDGHYSAVPKLSVPIINSSGTNSPSRPSSNNPLSPSDTNPNSDSGKYKVLPQLNIFQDAPLILDSGTSSILIPSDASQAIHSELSGTWDPIHRAWFLPCQGPDLIWWVSSGQHGIIQPYESLIYLLEDGRCQSLIFENPDANYWILGDTWLRGLYVVYDMEGTGRIGIATAKSLNATGSVGGSGEARILTVEDSSPARRLRPSLWGVASGSASGVGLVLMVAVHALIGILI
ncbi:MAG: aspartic peptidase domain-containing protein [Linnemannia elongata]|nr:MAG: aspartic peptidase domain-containing protein [Linnemannia elongata]